MSVWLASAIAAIVAGVSASREQIGKPNMVPANGYVTVCYGVHVFQLPYPIALRSLFPLLLGPRGALTEVVCERDSPRSYAYQALRMLFAWPAFALLHMAFGLPVMATAAALFILSLRFDYWSNFVELLAASIVLCAGRLGIPWPVQALSGMFLGLGRETLPLLALVPGGIPLAAGAAMSQATVRLLRKPNLHPLNVEFTKAIKYGVCRLDDVLMLLRQGPWETIPRLVLYVGLVGLAMVVVPYLAVALLVVTVAGSRIDEPRIVTMLIPWVAVVLCQWGV
jgi:hypothetical protein